MRGITLPMLVFGALAALAVTSCGGRPGSVTLAWQPAQGSELQLGSNASNDVFQTVIYVSNLSASTLRDTRLRLRPDAARNAPAGLRIGTVAPISSRFDGADQLWPVGDLAPGARVSVPLGLWFDLDNQPAQSHPIELTLDLVSPDLASAIASNALKVNLKP